MDNVKVYTDNEQESEHVIQINSDDVRIINDIQQEAIKLEESGQGFEFQRKVLQGVYGKGRASFDSRKTDGSLRRKGSRGAESSEGSVRGGDSEEVSEEAEENDRLNGCSHPMHHMLSKSPIIVMVEKT